MMCVSLVLAFAASVPAAPVPRGAEFKIKGWGDPVDPLSDCSFTGEGRTLSIHVPGKARDFDCETGNVNAPRVVRETEGDFAMTVKVGGNWPERGRVNNPLRVPFFSAGLLLVGDDRNYVRFEKGQLEWGGTVKHYIRLEHWQNGKQVLSERPKDAESDTDRPVHLKLVRKGGTVTGSYSFDGKAWVELKPLAATLGTAVKTGVVAVHDTETEFKPVFSDLSFE